MTLQTITVAAACVLGPADTAPVSQPVHPPDVYETKPLLRELMSDEAFWANFEQSPEPVMGESQADPRQAVVGTYKTAPGLVGNAFVSEKRSQCVYPVKGNLDLTRPGAIAFWVCPVAWERVKPTGIRNGLVRTNFSKQGYFGINRVAAKRIRRGLVQNDMVFFYADYFPGAKNVRIGLSDSRGPEWAGGTWHLFVINWKGTRFEVSLDGQGLKSGDLGRRLVPESVKEILIGGCQEPTLLDEVLVFRRPLSPAEVRVLFDALHPMNQAERGSGRVARPPGQQ